MWGDGSVPNRDCSNEIRATQARYTLDDGSRHLPYTQGEGSAAHPDQGDVGGYA